MALETSYTGRGSASASTGASDEKTTGQYWPLSKLRKCYTDYLFNKREEQDEQIDARRYYHGSQYTDKQIAALTARKQPVMTYNQVAEKINGYVGQVERARQDPKAYARTPQHEEGADLATAALRYVLDENEWNDIRPLGALHGAVDGLGGIAVELSQGDHKDPDVELVLVDIDSFFYDPRSYKHDFTDARYMGVGKWVDDDVARRMFPEADDNAFSGDSELHSNSDREMRWFRSDGVGRRVRIVEIWYKHKDGWCWALFSGNAVLAEGKSYLQDDKGHDLCKYVMFSANVDQDGDRYGFVRNLKSPQDGINAKQSKVMHILNSRRLFIRQGAVGNVEKIRAEYARPDGVIEVPGDIKDSVQADDRSFDFAGWTKMLEYDISLLNQSGPNAQLIGEEAGTKSGRAIALMQEAGLAKLGPYIKAFKGWKVRLYRTVWAGIKHWQDERWIRVTDNEGLAQYVAINKMEVGPDGRPSIMNAIGSLDVDIILDEGPDTVNAMQDMYETLQQVVPAVAPMLSPPEARAVVKMLIETSPLSSDQKKAFREAGEQPDPMADQMKQLELAGVEAKVRETVASAGLKEAQAGKAMSEAQVAPLEAMMNGQAPMQPGEYEPPPELQDAQVMAEIEETYASRDLKLAQAGKAQAEAALAPQKMMMEAANAQADRELNARNAAADRQFQAKNADADRKASAQQAKMKTQAQRNGQRQR
jgi:hypothetical protein